MKNMDELAYKSSNKKSKPVKLEKHNTVYTEAKLQKNGAIYEWFMSFCNTQVETLKHLFYDCTVIRQNWVKSYRR